MRNLIYIALLFCLIMPFNAKSQTLEYAYPNGSVWTMKRDENGVPYTPFVPYVQELFKRAGLPIAIRAYPPKRVFRNVASGKSQFSLLVKAPALMDCCIFSKKPITSIAIKAFYRKGNAPILSKDDLLGKKIAMVHGYSYGKLRQYIEGHENKTKIRSARDHGDVMFGILSRNKEEYAIDYGPVAKEVLRELPRLKHLPAVSIEENTLFEIDVFLILLKSYPNAQALMSRLEDISATIDIDRYIKELEQKTGFPLQN